MLELNFYMDIFLPIRHGTSHIKRLIACFTVIFLYSISIVSEAKQATMIESNGFKYSIGSTPEWVSSNAYSLASKQEKSAVRYVFVDQQVRLVDGNSTVFYRNVVQPLTTEGLQESSRIEVAFNPAYQKLVWHHASVKRQGKKMNRLSSSAITLMQREESLDQEIVDGYVTSMLVISDTRKGDIIDYSYSIEGRNPIYGEHVFYHSIMGWSVPVEKLNRRFIFERDDNVQFKLDKFTTPPEIIENNDTIEYQWTIENTDPVYIEDDYPSWYRAYPEVSFSSFQRWKDVSRWAAPLYKNRTITNPELLEFIQKIRFLTEKQKVAKALQFVQGEIRYLGVELGENSHKPHDPDEVFANRYGDCKDKTLLLIAILEKVGITSHPALVSTYGGEMLANALPSPGEFNHVITRVEGWDNVYWIDPTRSLQNGKIDQLGYVSYDNALVVGHPSLNLTEMPKTAKKIPEIRTYEYFNILAYEAPVDYQIVSEYTGIEAEYMHSQFVSQGKSTIATKYLNYMSRMYPSLQLAAPLDYSYDTDINQLTVTASYRITEFFRKESDTLLTDIYPYSIVDYLSLPTTVKRKTPLRHFSPVKLTHQVHVRYPEWVNMSLYNDTPPIDTPYFSLSYEEDYRDRSIVSTYVYQAKLSYVKNKDVSTHISALRNAKSNLSKTYEISYEKDSARQLLGEFIEQLNRTVDKVNGERR